MLELYLIFKSKTIVFQSVKIDNLWDIKNYRNSIAQYVCLCWILDFGKKKKKKYKHFESKCADLKTTLYGRSVYMHLYN